MQIPGPVNNHPAMKPAFSSAMKPAFSSLLGMAVLLTALGAADRTAAEEAASKIKRLEKDISSLKSGRAAVDIGGIVKDAKEVGGAKVISARMDDMDISTLRATADNIRKKVGASIIVLGSDLKGKVTLVCAVSKDITEKGAVVSSINWTLYDASGIEVTSGSTFIGEIMHEGDTVETEIMIALSEGHANQIDDADGADDDFAGSGVFEFTISGRDPEYGNVLNYIPDLASMSVSLPSG